MDSINGGNYHFSNLEAWLRLNSISGIGPITTLQLLEYFKSPEAILSASEEQLRASGANQKLSTAIIQSPHLDISPVQKWLESSEQHHLVTLQHGFFPRLLSESASPPTMLYCKGDVSLLNAPQIAIVGTRHPSVSGKTITEEFAAELVRQGLCITSGLALGVDGIAHQTALSKQGKTIAVAGTGLDRVYPASHQVMAHKIAENGLIVSEFPLKTRIRGSNFPRRNRIISGLSLGVLVVEAAIKSGSLITANCALEQGREVFALPGSINNPVAKGCHALIKQGAHLVETVNDILQHLNWLYQAQHQLNISNMDSKPTTGPVIHTRPDDDELTRILRWIDFAPTSLDLLVERCKKPVAELSAKLITLELQGWVASVPGGYQRQK